MKQGFVSIVGAGPGDPDLLTIKAFKALSAADVVVYDRLVPVAMLDLMPRGTARIFAGKSCKDHFMTQGEINQLLATLAQKGKRIARLKGGDPFIFGRGGEEAEYLAKRHIPFEIIPGITSASGCSAYAGIPLTHRGLASSVRYVTGHVMEKSATAHSDGTNLGLNWQSLADPDTTLVVYMGLANLRVIAARLIEHGLPASTPAAAIQAVTTAKQKLLITDVSSLPEKVAEEGFEAPTTLIIGRVVALAEKLAPSNTTPSYDAYPSPNKAPRSQTSNRR